jgi:NADPH:quinone reductase-like Zn-dependent oxidoreductase
MKVVSISEYGGADKLEMRELNKPQPAANDVLVEVKYASINPVDWKIRRGDVSFILPRKFPRVLGIDVAGVVAAVGSAVRKFKVGERVFGMADPFRNQYGSYAEYCLVQDTKLAPMPEKLSFEDAASIPVAGLTAYKALFEHRSTHSGDRVLVNGGAGGVGTFAVQLAKTVGAHVTATCGPGNIEFVRSLGADVVLDYNLFDAKKIDDRFSLIFDVSAKFNYFDVKHLLLVKGLFVTTVPKPDFILASALSPFSSQKAVAVFASMGNNISQQMSEIANLILLGKLKPVISNTVTLGQVAAAQTEGEKEHTRGKVVVRI